MNVLYVIIHGAFFFKKVRKRECKISQIQVHEQNLREEPSKK